MNPVQRADQAAYLLNNSRYKGADEEVEALEVLRVAMTVLKKEEAKEEYAQAILAHADAGTFLVACHRGMFKLAQMIHQTAFIKLSDLVTKGGLSPMHMAANIGNVEFMEYLEKYNVAIDKEADHGWTPLHSACLKGHTACIAYLLKRGADADRVGGPQKLTPAKLVELSKNQAAIKAFAEARILIQEK